VVNDNRLNTCIVTFPISAAGFPPLANLMSIICKFSRKVYIISSSDFSKVYSYSKHNVFFYSISNRELDGLLMVLLKFLKAQLEIVIRILIIRSYVDFYLFFIGGESLFLPMLVAKFFKKKVVLCHSGSIVESAKQQKMPLVNALIMIREFTRLLADRIIVYSNAIIYKDGLDKFRYKIAIAHEHFIDFKLFDLCKVFSTRESVVGYAGRFTLEKGISNLAKAIPLIFKHKPDVNFVFIGDGPLFYDVNKCLVVDGHKVKVLKWVPREKIPNFLNEMKLLVLPSLTEGMPNIVLEAMACGTPVLATPVGAIPDIIKDGETGFLLRSNDPKHIAERIIELLNKHELLEKVSIDAYNYIRENFNYEKTLEAWQKIIKELKQH